MPTATLYDTLGVATTSTAAMSTRDRMLFAGFWNGWTKGAY